MKTDTIKKVMSYLGKTGKGKAKRRGDSEYYSRLARKGKK